MKNLIIYIYLLSNSFLFSQNQITSKISFAGKEIILPNSCKLFSDNEILYCDDYSIKWDYSESEKKINKKYKKEFNKIKSLNKIEKNKKVTMYSFDSSIEGEEIEVSLSDGPYYTYLLKGNINEYYTLIRIETVNQIKNKSQLKGFISNFISIN